MVCGMEALRQLILAELDRQGLSYREAAARSKGLISYSTLNVIATGSHAGEISDRTLSGIALALDIPVRKVRQAYGRTAVEPAEFTLPDRSKHLSPKQRKAVLSMIDAFLDGKPNGSANTG